MSKDNRYTETELVIVPQNNLRSHGHTALANMFQQHGGWARVVGVVAVEGMGMDPTTPRMKIQFPDGTIDYMSFNVAKFYFSFAPVQKTEIQEIVDLVEEFKVGKDWAREVYLAGGYKFAARMLTIQIDNGYTDETMRGLLSIVRQHPDMFGSGLLIDGSRP